jgi:hypothetical protein
MPPILTAAAQTRADTKYWSLHGDQQPVEVVAADAAYPRLLRRCSAQRSPRADRNPRCADRA